MIIKNIKKSIELSKSGKPYARVLLQFEEYQSKDKMRWISGFGNKDTWAWRVGDDVQPDITENGNYLNFSFNDSKENKLDVYRLAATIDWVIKYTELLKGRPTNQQEREKYKPEEPQDEIPL